MSCYFRHIKDILDEAGIEVTSSNKKHIDQTIHQLVGITYRDCPATWKSLKQITGDKQKRQDFIGRLRNAVN